MNCPVCKTVALVMSDRQGIEIDYCPQCRGVWLDRGELDKIVERSVPQAAAPQPEFRPQAQPYPPQQAYPQRGYEGEYHKEGHYKKKHKGFLGELFDFD